MKDVRPMAEQRAKEKAEGRTSTKPPGSGFMTERAKAKEALRAEVSKRLTISDPEQSGHYVLTYKLTSAQATYTGDFCIRMRLQYAANGATFHVWNVKLEKGNRATDWTPAPEDVDAAIAEVQSFADTVQSYAEGIQSQLDGKIDTWFFSGAPSSTTEPEVNWTAAQKEDHTDDLYYDTSTGYCYRYTGSSGTYSWTRIKDSDITSAMTAASTAKDIADNKRRVFTSQPVPPYDIGDMWAGGSSTDLKVCATAKAAGKSYAASDWVLAAASVSTLSIGGRNLLRHTAHPTYAGSNSAATVLENSTGWYVWNTNNTVTMHQIVEFLSTWYGFAGTVCAALAMLWGGTRAVGALRRWLHKRYKERQDQLAAPGKLLKAIETMRTELTEQNREQNRRMDGLAADIQKVEAALEDNNNQVATLQLKELNWAYIHYGIKHHPIPLHSKNSLEQMYQQYVASGKHNHVPLDWQEKMNSCPIEGENGGRL